jgi:hypothetical protein
MKQHTKASPLPVQTPEEEVLAQARLCVRVMERFLGSVDERPDTRSLHAILFGMYMETLQDELAPYAFDLAYALFSREKVATERRREWDRE